MSTASKKAKGRRLQNRVVSDFREMGKQFGLVDDDIKPASMGMAGVDIIMSPAAQKVFDVSVECKNQERERIMFPSFIKHFRKYHNTYDYTNGDYTRKWNGNTSLKFLVYDKNYLREGPLVLMRYEDFIELVRKALPAPILSQPFIVPKDGQKDEAQE